MESAKVPLKLYHNNMCPGKCEEGFSPKPMESRKLFETSTLNPLALGIPPELVKDASGITIYLEDKATEYIQYVRRKNDTHQQDIDDLKRQNALLEQQGFSKALEAVLELAL
ncbi:protein L-Myc-1-like protein [Cricetulus griseus]|nr:protein L-Myc-1-like protein [Cricetulus griseus]